MTEPAGRTARRIPRPSARLRAFLPRRLRAWLALAVAVGVATGLGVAVLDLVIEELVWGPLSRRHAYWVAALPILGLVAASGVVARTRDRSRETTESYIRAFHDPRGETPTRDAPWRLLASTLTIALGGSLGLEGPSIFLGAVVGDTIERRFRKLFDREDVHVLLVAGAAAGIAAIFKAPVTGIIFALEVPYRDDLARHALVPAIFAAASSYLVFVGIVGLHPLFPVLPAPFAYTDLLVALLVGVACGLVARAFVWLLHETDRRFGSLPTWARPVVAGVVLAIVGVIAIRVFALPLPLGPGYNGILVAARGQLLLRTAVLLLVLKLVSTSVTVGGGGVGGLFFPSVMMGAAVGGALGRVLPGPPSLFAVVGIAAFLGGAYKVPLAGVAFVAETTGAPGYVIPGLLAAALGYLVSGPGSVSLRQRFRRRGDLEDRLDVSVAEAMIRDWVEVPPGTSLQQFATRHAVLARSKTVPVAEAGRYVGMVNLDSLRNIPVERWSGMTVDDVMSTTHPSAEPSWRLARALRVMREHAVDRVAVLEGERIIGMLSTSDVLRLDEIVDAVREHAEPEDRA